MSKSKPLKGKKIIRASDHGKQHQKQKSAKEKLVWLRDKAGIKDADKTTVTSYLTKKGRK